MTEGLVQAEEDLAVLLEHVGSDRRPAARAEMARSADTRAFLEIGVELLVGDLLQHAGPDPDGASPAAVLFRGLSRQRLVEKGAALRAAGRLAGTTTSESQFKDRWRYADRYTEDLIAYLFRLDLYRAHGLALAPGHTWLDVAELFNTVVEGSAQRILADDARVRLSNGNGILAASIRLMITSLASLPPGTSLDELYPVAPS
jgi:hypothetical protein